MSRKNADRSSNIQINLVGNTSTQLVNMLISKELDYAFVILSDSDLKKANLGDIVFEKIDVIKDILVISKNFEMDFENVSSLSDLVGFPFISIEPGNKVREYIDEAFLSQGILFTPAFNVGSMGQVLKLAESGLGLGIVPEYLAVDKIKKGDLIQIPLNDLFVSRFLYFAHLKDVPSDTELAQIKRLIQ